MGLMAKIKKALDEELAIAIPAIPAIEKPKPPLRIATIATIAVASADDPKNDGPSLRLVRPSEGNSDTAIFANRVRTFEAKGIASDDAEGLARRLTIRDQQLDDRKSCAECVSYHVGRCSQNRQPFGGGGVEVLHRCGGFRAIKLLRYNDP